MRALGRLASRRCVGFLICAGGASVGGFWLLVAQGISERARDTFMGFALMMLLDTALG